MKYHNIFYKLFFQIYKFIKYRIVPLEEIPKSPNYFRSFRYFNNHPEMRRYKGGWIYKNKKYPDYLFVGGASFAIFRKAKTLLKGKGVDIGAGYWAFPGSTPIDASRGEGYGNSINDFQDNQLDYIFSSHCLEHILCWTQELDKWISKLKNKGRLFLYLPHPECEIWHPGAPAVKRGHKWTPEYKIIKEYFEFKKMKIVYSDEGPDQMMSFSICAEKIN